MLRCAWLCRAPFEWGEHVDIGKRYGLSAEEVERVTQGSSAPGWSEHDAAILRGVEELIGDQALSDATWETLAKSWNEAQMIRIPDDGRPVCRHGLCPEFATDSAGREQSGLIYR